MDDGKGKRQGRAGHIAAADIEEPGNGIRLGQDGCLDPQLLEACGNLLALLFRALPGETQGMGQDLPERRFRPIAPDGIERVLRAGHERTPGPLAIGRQAAHLAFRMQPGIIAELAPFEMCTQPGRERFFADVAVLVELRIGLLFRLQCVAPIDEKRGTVQQYRCQAGGAAEAGQPSQAVSRRRHIFALMFIRTRHEEAVEATVVKLRTQSREADRLSREIAHGRRLMQLVEGGKRLQPRREKTSCCTCNAAVQ